MLHVNRVPIDVIAASFGKSEDAIREMISNPYLISLDEALRRVKLKEYLPSLVGVQPLITSPEEDDSIRKLTKEFRNEFEHFSPKGWMIFTSGMPDMVHNVLRVITFLQFESNCIFMPDDKEKRLKSAISKIEHLLNVV